MKTILTRLNGLAHAASRRSDVVVATFMMLAVVMIVIPLPTVVVDLLIAINISISLLILVVAFYIGRPAEFSALPPIILLGTLFRLALSISTTRLILTQGDAGSIVETFGRFVIGGQVVVGLVVFLIITAAQFIVITKGAERVAEVAARFTLDAMPGKQMAIDNDLRNGDIDQTEARVRRGRLERESQLYGAMDGAMKFVKGDAITGLVIVFVNLIGGLLIGMMQRGMSFADAAHTYSLLTVGDGLIAQIPALLISIAAGTVVTRVVSETESDLGTEILGQLGASEKALGLAAAIVGAAAFVPGFPTLIFLAVAGVFGGFAVLAARRKRASAAETDRDEEPGAIEAPLELEAGGPVVSSGSSRHRVTAYVGEDLYLSLPLERFGFAADEVREALKADLGLDIPAVELRMDARLASDRFRVDLEGVPVMEGDLPRNRLMLDDDPMHLDLLQIPYDDGAPLLKGRRTIWIDDDHAEAVGSAGIGSMDAMAVLAACLGQVLRRYAAHFVGIQETREILTSMETEYGELVREATRVVPLQKLSDILRRLVEEDVPIGNVRAILEALVEWGPREADTMLLTERVRAALGRQICHRHAQLNRVVAACVVARSAEDVLRNSLKQTGVGTILALPDEASKSIVGQLRRGGESREGVHHPVVLTSMDVRRALRNFLVRNEIDLPVLSFQEIASEYSVQSLMSVTVLSHSRNRPVRAIGKQSVPALENNAAATESA